MSDENNQDYKWRPATKGDIGSIARFGDTNEGPWLYGILKGIRRDGDSGFVYYCDDAGQDDESWTQSYFACQIQYDANKEP